MSSTDPIRVIHSSKSNLELIHSANTVNCRSAPTIKLSHISSARYQPRATRIHRTRRQPIYYENSWKQGISQLKKIPRLLSSPYHHRITPISQRKFVPVDTSMHFDTQITKPKHKWMNSIKRISIPTFIRNSNILRELSESNGKKRRKKRRIFSPWILFCCLLCCALLLSAIVAVLLIELLPKPRTSTSTTSTSTTSTTSTSTTTTTSMSTTSSTSTSSTSTTSSTSSTTSTTTSTSATTSTASTTTTIT
ncbi:unnamed protein product, partial [Rotaria magnacalcarata]